MPHKTATLRDKIVQFWKLRLTTDPVFTFQQMSDFVNPDDQWRPNSPGRVFELLRKEGQINYLTELVNFKNRRASLYRAVPLRQPFSLE